MADRVLVVNAGSSTLKLCVLARGEDRPVAAATLEEWEPHDSVVIREFVGGQQIDAVGHRIVHGGDRFAGPAVLDEGTREAIAALTPMAPLHQPRALAAIDATRQALGDLLSVACFDTAFHASMPVAASTYALPAAWRQQWALRRYGFHGLSHRWAARRAAVLLDRPVETLAMVTCHLGAGASLCAVAGGASVDTTMGFTPLEGLVMATRSGTVDPGLVLWLLRQGLSVEEVEDGLERHGGLLALAGSGDMREVLARREKGEAAATAAFDVYIHRLGREIAGMTAALGRLDVLVFTGGVGEHAPAVRAAAAERLAHLGVAVDADGNDRAEGDAVITRPGARAETVVVTSREDLQIADQVRTLLGSS